MSAHHTLAFAWLLGSTALLACQMPNPAFEDGADELADASERGDTQESGSSTAEGESGAEAASSEAESSDCTPGDPCGECRVCNTLGQCDITPGAECGAVECSDYVFGEVSEKCVAFGSQVVDSLCSEQGACKPALEQCNVPGEVLCELACASACVPMAIVDEGTCAPDGPTPECMGAECLDLATLVTYACVDGFCTGDPTECGGGTFCGDGMCIDQG